ncbi:MAG TPA: zf-HC2 domain-containing protein [Leifsonia sp.]|jgi:hypothetical protein|nr:zf-HC2 domain-containing protein [Leifsonia sp.]
MTTHDEFATWDGAYLLGALSPADRRAYEEHLRTCPACSESVTELAGLPGLLGRVSDTDAFALLDSGNADADAAGAVVAERDAAQGASPEILPALLSAVRRRRLRTRFWTAGSLAAAAVVVALTAVVLPAVLAPAPVPRAGTSVVMTQVEPSALTADLNLVAEPWGTRIESRCSYAAWSGEDAGRVWTYAMIVTDRSGKQTQISTWNATAGTTVEPTATTSVRVADIASVDIRSAVDGTVLLRSTFKAG